MRASERQALTAMLNQAIAAGGGNVTGDVVRRAADGFGISTRTVHRHLKTMRDGGPATHTVRAGWWSDPQTRQLVLAAVASCDSLKQAWRRLHADKTITVSYPQFTRQYSDNIAPAVAAGLRGNGREDYLQMSLYLEDVPERPNTRWQADSQEVPVWVRPDNGTAPFKPWQVTFVDEATRMVMATILLPGPPGGEDAVAALAAAVRGFRTADGTFVGGIPQTIKWDNGTEFINQTVTAACLRLNIAPFPAAPYSPWQKGKIERWHRTIQTELYSHLPGASDGPRSFQGTEWWRGADTNLLPFSALVLKMQDWVVEYNTERVHSAIGCTPLTAWKAKATNVAQAAPQQLFPLMLRASSKRTVSKDGIRFEGRRYLAAGLAKYRGRKVDIRLLPLDGDTIYVFDGDDFICEAVPSGQLGTDERRTVVQQRHADWQTIKAAHERAAVVRAQTAVINAATAPPATKTATPTPSRPPYDAAGATGIFAESDALTDLLGDDDL